MRSIGAIEAIQSVVPDLLVVPFLLLTRLGDPILAVVLLLVAYWFGDRRQWATLLGVVAGGLALALLAKSLFALPRPTPTPPVPPEAIPELLRPEYVDTVSHQEGSGFPSGHATTATVLWGVVATSLARGSRRIRYGLAGLVVAVVCLSRIVLGVHYLVDVVAGVALGAGYLLVAYRILETYDPAPTHALAMGSAIAVVAGVASGGRPAAVAGTGAVVGALLGWTLVEVPPDPWPTNLDGVWRSGSGLAAAGLIVGGGTVVGGVAALFLSTMLAVAAAVALPAVLVALDAEPLR